MGTESERLSERYDKTSPWPIVIVLGVVISEIGILFGLYPLAVGGLVMLVGSVSGIVYEAGYVAAPWRLLSGLGIVLFVLGSLLMATQGDVTAPGALLSAAGSSGIALRGLSIAATGAILAVFGVVFPRLRSQR